MKISEESFAAPSCSMDRSCLPSQGRLAARGGERFTRYFYFHTLNVLGSFGMFRGGRMFLSLDAEAVPLFSDLFTPVSPCTRLLKPSPKGSIICNTCREKNISPCPHQAPSSDWIIFLPLVFLQSQQGEAEERLGAIPAFSKCWCDSCHPTSADVMGMRIEELCPHAALCKWIALISGGFPCTIFRYSKDNRGMSILMQTERNFRCSFPPGAGEKSRRRKTRQSPPAFLSLLEKSEIGS